MVDYAPGDIVPFRLHGGIVAASYFVSLAGAITSVELLHRRICNRGWSKWLELFFCALTFALVGIWCMHYVGNRAIVLGDGAPNLQLVYNPGYTALSTFLPIIAMVAAFTIADVRHRGHNKRFVASLVVSGILAGNAVVAMHYTGDLGVANYHIEFRPSHIGGAIIIACVVCVTALALIFVLQDRWISILPYRLFAAALLAGGVSSMHFEATMGTTYRLKYRLPNGDSRRNTNLIFAVVFSLLTIPVCVGLSVANARRQKLLSDRAQQVILACARFDVDGRIMVTSEGLLPSQKITSDDNYRSFDEQFNINHPAFQWCFRLSYNWSSIMRWLPNMNKNLRALREIHFVHDLERTNSESRSSSISWELNDDFPLIFRQSFAVAAAKLASDLKEILCDVGTLYDGVMLTGTLAGGGHHRRRSILGYRSGTPVGLVKDLEASNVEPLFGKGQLLFLVQQCDGKAVARLTAEGYRFVHPTSAEKHMAKSMQVPPAYLHDYLKSVQQHAKSEHNLDAPQGTLLGLFVLRAGIQKRNFEVLVREDVPYRLPCVQLSQVMLDPLKRKMIAQFEDLPVTACLLRLAQKLDDMNDPEREFWIKFRSKILALQGMVDEPWFCNALFSSKVIKVSTLTSVRNVLSSYSLIVFHIVPDVHAQTLKSSLGLTYTPFSFFKCRQQVLEGLQHRASFDRKVHQEFASIFAAKDVDESTRKPRKGLYTNLPFKWPKTVSATSSVTSLWSLASRHKDISEQKGKLGMVEMDSNTPFGGIMVNSDVTVETMVGTECKQPQETLIHVGNDVVATSAYAGTGDVVHSTYADELYALTVAKWSRRI